MAYVSTVLLNVLNAF